MKRLNELTAEQKSELKQALLMRRNEESGETTSYGELAWADEAITNEELEAEYGNTTFTDDDFTCTASAE